MIVDVRKQGNVWTVFLDDNGRPMSIPAFDAPPMGFPFTGKDAIQNNYPGATFRFVEKEYPKQPESVFTPAMEKDLAALTAGQPPAAPKDAHAAPTPVQALRDHVGRDALSTYVDKITNLFSEYLRTNDADTEAVGTFLITAIPELEPILKELANAKPKEKKVFKL